MNTNFQIHAIPQEKILALLEMDEKQLAEIGAVKQIVDSKPGYPCRLSLEDAEIGEEVILFPYRHHDTLSPYQSEGPIYIRRGVKQADLNINELAPILLHRHLSLRAYDKEGMMRKALTTKGEKVAEHLKTLFALPEIHYIHIHNAGPGCFNCEVRRSS